MALIKRLLSRKNTSPSQRLLLFCRTSSRSLPWPEPSSRFLRPVFQTLWFRALYGLQPGTHQVQACTKDNLFAFLVQALVRKADPRKISVLCHVQVVVDKTLGAFRASHSGLMTKADQEECSLEPSVFLSAWDSVPIKEMGFSPPYAMDHRPMR